MNSNERVRTVNLEDSVPGLVHINCIETSENKQIVYAAGDLSKTSSFENCPVIIVDILSGTVIGKFK